jgi:putative tricarboxylic transport membrane protein
MRIRGLFIAAIATAALALGACGSDGGGGGGGAGDYPTRNLDWTIAFGPGGGNDIMARTMVDILQDEKLYPESIAVRNREGGSGATGWGYLFSHEGDPYQISTTSGSFITTPLQADTGWTWEDFTLVGLFATDDALFLVRPKSGIRTWEEWVSFAKRKGTVTVGGIGTVNVDFIQHQMLAEKAGYKIKYVPYNEEGQVLTSLLSGALDAAVSNPAEVLGQIRAEKLTPLLFTGKEPLKALPDVPTGEAKGYTGLPSLPRGLILAPNVPDDVRQWWIDTMKKLVVTPAWKRYLEQNALTEDVRWGPDFERYLNDTTSKLEKTLKEQGAI